MTWERAVAGWAIGLCVGFLLAAVCFIYDRPK
jgi:hypothetical protein